MKEKIEIPEAGWRVQLTEQQYHVTRDAGTEVPFTGQYHDPMAAWLVPGKAKRSRASLSSACQPSGKDSVG